MVFTDQMNRKIELPEKPLRIISLVPSQSELLFSLGLNEEVVGITKFCVHPNEWFTSKPKIGGTKNIDIEKIKSLNPDLIIGNKEENEKQQIEELMKHFRVWMSDVNSLKDAYDMIVRVGALVGKQQQAILLKLQVESAFNLFINKASLNPQHSVAYFIWKKPYMVAAGNTFINDILGLCGLKNVFAEHDYMRYPEIQIEQLEALQPECIFLSSEPYPFKEKHIEEFKSICPQSKVIVVDGELFSWYGSRLLNAPKYLSVLLDNMNGSNNN
jgi:ABC-type Fe3+-hydroxamate transport system substrate-binding protein